MTEVPEQPSQPAPAAPAAPAGRSIDEIKRDPLVARVCEKAGDAIIGAKEFAGEISLTVARDRIVEVAKAFRDDGFNYLVDLSGVDYSKYPAHAGLRFGVGANARRRGSVGAAVAAARHAALLRLHQELRLFDVRPPSWAAALLFGLAIVGAAFLVSWAAEVVQLGM